MHQLNLKIEELETKLAASEVAKSASETLSSDIEHDLKKEKDSEICQLKLKNEDLETKLSRIIIIYNEIEPDLKKETHEANQIRAKLEQDLSKEKEIAQKLQQSLKNEIDSLKVEISEKSANLEMEKENCTKLEQDFLRKTESFDQLIWRRRRKKSIQK